MGLVRLIYGSKPFGFDDAMLNGILSDARRCNARDGITGALVCRADVYLQLIEGEEAAIEAAFARIAADDRHVEVKRLSLEAADKRMFPDWAMKDDPARSWLWTQEQVAKGALNRASEAELLAVFERVAAEG
ncbi:hypothetical protein BH09PSE2_BH09PSE2_18390 [soil metagenome]